MANKIARWRVGIAVLAGVLGCLSLPVFATPSLPPDSYSWSQVFVEPESVHALDQYGGAYPIFGSPIKGYPPIYLPYGQANSYQNPHQGIDIDCRRGTAVVTIAAGFIESVIGNTVIQACDLDANGTVDVRVHYMHLGKVLVAPDPNNTRPKGYKIGTSGTDPADGVNKLHFTIQGYYDFVGANLNVRPDKFFHGVANWNDGSDTAFMKKIYRDSNSHVISFTAYCLDDLGARVAPSEVAVFHRRNVETAWRVTYLTPDAYGNYSFDFLAYRENGEQVYLPGFRVHHIMRAKAPALLPQSVGEGVTPAAISDYRWEFSPCLNERPYENPADWPGSGQKWSYWYMDLPNVTIVTPASVPDRNPEHVYGLWPIKVKLVHAEKSNNKIQAWVTLAGGQPRLVSEKTLPSFNGEYEWEASWDTTQELKDKLEPVPGTEPGPEEDEQLCNVRVDLFDSGGNLLVSRSTDVRIDQTFHTTSYNQPTILHTRVDNSLDHEWDPWAPFYPPPMFQTPMGATGPLDPLPTDPRTVEQWLPVTSRCLEPRLVTDPTTGHEVTYSYSTPHEGVDFAAAKFTAVYPPMEGWLSGEDPASGLLRIQLDINGNELPDDNRYCVLQHLELTRPIAELPVMGEKAGWVTTDTWVGLSGDTGSEGAPHLHYQIKTAPNNPNVWDGATNLLYDYHSWDYHWNNAEDLDFISNVDYDRTGVAATVRECSGYPPNPTDFDSERVRLYYRTYDPLTHVASTWVYVAMQPVSAGSSRFYADFPSSTAGRKIDFMIRARRANGVDSPLAEQYYNFAFYPPRMYRPQPWPQLATQVDPGYPYDYITLEP